jgi:carboxylesterase type B
VRDNIVAFGGDPERISLWGESAGAYAVDAYLFSYAQDPIIKGVIADSGNALAIPGALLDENNHSIFSLAAKDLGCGNLNTLEELECMRNVPGSEMQEWLQGDIGEGGAVDENIMFGAIADNATFFKNYEDRIGADESKFASSIPLLIGTNTEEGQAVVPYNFPGSETATELPDDLEVISQRFGLNLQCTTLKEIRLRAEAGAVTFQYLYAGNFTNISPRPWLGAYHTAELPLIFGTHAAEGASTDFEQKVSDKMQDLWLEFIKDPQEGLAKAGWPKATSQPEGYKLAKLAADGELKQLISIKRLKEECLDNGFEV